MLCPTLRLGVVGGAKCKSEQSQRCFAELWFFHGTDVQAGRGALQVSSMHTSRDLEAALAEPLGSWRVRDIDWKYVLGAQHYGTALTTLAILIALIVVHWTLEATQRVFFLYDAAISYVSHGDTVPACVAVAAPLVCFLISLISYEFVVYRRYFPRNYRSPCIPNLL